MNMALHDEQSQCEVVTKSSYASRTRSSKRGTECSSSETKKKLKITIKDPKMHHLIFQEGGLVDGTKVVYRSGEKEQKKGDIQGRRIRCTCCKEEFSPSGFEKHAGKAYLRKPYENIYLTNGKSLHEYAVSLTINCENVTQENDALCRECKRSGDLLFCKGCPRSFHKECIKEPVLHQEKWFCRFCVKWLGLGNANAKRRIQSTDDHKNHELVACVLCRASDFSKNGFSDRTAIVCDQCEKEYHISCLRVHKKIVLEQLPQGNWFCTADCKNLHEDLNVLDTIEPETVGFTNHDVKWIIRRCKDASEENRLLLKQAVEIFHECFDPIIDLETGKDFITSMAYGLEMGDSDFSGVHCAMLIIDSKVITAGMFRVFGHGLAELPLVATDKHNQGKGYLKLFFLCFKQLLLSLQVKKLVVQAAENTKAMWVKKFGFRKVIPVQLREYQQKHPSMVAFNCTSLLEKRVCEDQWTYKNDEFSRERTATTQRQRSIQNNNVASSSVDPQEEIIILRQRLFDMESQLLHMKKELEKSESEKSVLQNQVQALQIFRN